MIHRDIVIVGAGHGGAHAAIALRKHGFAGSVLVLGRERELPYERPPLTKEYLSRGKPFERMLIRPAAFWAERDIELMPGALAVKVDPVEHALTLSDGEGLSYGKLIWAAGGDPRRLSCDGADLKGVHYLRDKADVDGITAAFEGVGQSPNVVIIGGGYIGLETAAVLIGLGCKVTLLEALPRVLARVAGEDLSRFYEAEHRAQGVDLRTGVTVDCIQGDGRRVTGVRLADGDVLPASMVVVGIGIVPATRPLEAAGAAHGNGVHVDEFCRASLPNIYAIGDCAAHANGFAGGAVIRLESVQNANDMATTAARHICGDPQPYHALPWFWSNQYDLKLQTAGLSLGHDATVLRGDPASRSFSVIYLKEGRFIAIDCVNAVKDYVQAMKLVEAGAVIDPERFVDTQAPFKEMVIERSMCSSATIPEERWNG